MKQSGNDAEQNEMLIRANDKYTLFEWTILLGSIITSLAFIFITKNYYILEIILEIDLDHYSSIIQALKIYAYVVIGVWLLMQGCQLLNWRENLVKEIKEYLFKNAINLLLFIMVSLYIWYFAQNSPITKKTKGQTLSKVYHYIVWFIFGSVSSIIGHFFGQLCSIRTFTSFGQITILTCYLMAFSTLYTLQFGLKKDLFDMII